MERPRAIGGSDAAVVLGISPWKTRYQLWRELVGESEPVAEENERLRWGKLLEEPVAREYAERTGRKIRRVNRTLVHPELPYVTGHLDRDVVRGDDPEKRILEVKTTDTWNRTEWGPSGSDEVPDHYLTQVQHYMALTGADICDVAVLVGGNDFRVLHVPRNDRLIGAMLERYVDFWERHVEAKVPPEVETLGDAKTRWPLHDPSKTVVATPDVLSLLRDLDNTRAAARAEEKRAEEILKQLYSLLEDAEAVVADDGKPLATFKSQNSTRVDMGALREAHADLVREFERKSTTRVLRITKAGKEKLSA